MYKLFEALEYIISQYEQYPANPAKFEADVKAIF